MDKEEPIYRCPQCEEEYTREGSLDGCSHRCPYCGLFGKRVEKPLDKAIEKS